MVTSRSAHAPRREAGEEWSRPSNLGRRRVPRIRWPLAPVVAIVATIGAAAPAAVEVQPCSLLTLEEVATVLGGPATQDPPQRVGINDVTVGGNCVYRSPRNPSVRINLKVDAYPSGHQRAAFERGRQRSHVVAIAGLGDLAYAETPPGGPSSVTFLRGQMLVSVTVQNLGVAEAKRLAALVAPRLPVSSAEASTTTGRPQPSPSAPGSLPPPPTPSERLSGGLDPALVGSWFLTQPNGRALANLTVRPDGVFFLELIAGNKRTSGRIEGQDGVLRMQTHGGRVQEVQYRVVAANQMEWIDQNGSVTVVRRRFR